MKRQNIILEFHFVFFLLFILFLYFNFVKITINFKTSLIDNNNFKKRGRILCVWKREIGFNK